MAQPAAPDLTWRIAATHDDALTAARFIRDTFDLDAFAPVNPSEAMQTILDAVLGGFVAVIEDHGKIAGVLMLAPARWWWSDHSFLDEQALCLAPEIAGRAGLRVVFRAARAMSEMHGIPVRLTVRNEKRTASLPEVAREGEMYEFRPAGVSVRIEAAQ